MKKSVKIFNIYSDKMDFFPYFMGQKSRNLRNYLSTWTVDEKEKGDYK